VVKYAAIFAIGPIAFYGETNVSMISNAFAQGAAGGGAESSLMSFLPLILMFAVLYFIMIRPQMKRQKEHRNMLAAMAKGDEVVTNGGVVGKVTKVGEAYVGVEISEGTEILVQKSAVTTILPKGTIKSL
jgi:preprotein translocase subunit YajC